MDIVNKGNRIVLTFENSDEMVDYADMAPAKWKGRLSSREDFSSFLTWFHIQFPDDNFDQFGDELKRELQKLYRHMRAETGTDTWADAVKLAKFGWPGGRKSLISISMGEPPVSTEVVGRLVLDYGGAFPSVVEFLCGNPEHMLQETVSSRPSNNLVRIYVSALANASVRSANIKLAGAAALSIIDAIENAGGRVELTWLAYSKPSSDKEDGPDIIIKARLKEFDQPLEIDRLAFWCMHAGATRRIEFAVDERLDVQQWYGETHGRAINDTRELRGIVEEDAIIMAMGHGFESIGEAFDQILDQLDDEMAFEIVRQLPNTTKRADYNGSESFVLGGNVATAPIPRNAPCQCGSGKRFKHCHGSLV